MNAPTLDTIRSGIWRAVFPARGTSTTAELAAALGCKTKDVYRNARALARKRFVVITPPLKDGKRTRGPATISLHPSKEFLAAPK